MRICFIIMRSIVNIEKWPVLANRKYIQAWIQSWTIEQKMIKNFLKNDSPKVVATSKRDFRQEYNAYGPYVDGTDSNFFEVDAEDSWLCVVPRLHPAKSNRSRVNTGINHRKNQQESSFVSSGRIVDFCAREGDHNGLSYALGSNWDHNDHCVWKLKLSGVVFRFWNTLFSIAHKMRQEASRIFVSILWDGKSVGASKTVLV